MPLYMVKIIGESMKTENKISIMSAIIAASALCLSIWQGIQLQQEINNQSRPWLGIINFTEYDKNRILFTYTNFGKIPNIDGKVSIIYNYTLISKDRLYDASSTNDLGVIFPTQNNFMELTGLSTSVIEEAKSGKPLYLGVLVQYDYANDGKGEYGVIVQYSTTLHTFIIVRDWTK